MKELPLALLTAASVQILCQIFKFIAYSIKDKKLNLYYLTTNGGMPSSHSAFVSSIAVSVGIRGGFNSDIFSVSAVFAIIVIFDAYRVRGTIQKQSIVLNELITKHFPSDKQVKLREMVGHSIPEILAGVAVGCALAFPLTLFVFPG